MDYRNLQREQLEEISRSDFKSVPAHRGNFETRRIFCQRTHFPRDEPQPRVNAVFGAFLVQQLHAETYTQKRLARTRLGNQESGKSVFVQKFFGVAERAYARKNDFVRRRDYGLFARHYRVDTQAFQRSRQTEKIAYAVIDYRYHNTPLVEGISSAYSGSIPTASLTAFPKALNTASIMWCVFLPDIFLT